MCLEPENYQHRPWCMVFKVVYAGRLKIGA
jgi:hypothetical protein